MTENSENLHISFLCPIDWQIFFPGGFDNFNANQDTLGYMSVEEFLGEVRVLRPSAANLRPPPLWGFLTPSLTLKFILHYIQHLRKVLHRLLIVNCCKKITLTYS